MPSELTIKTIPILRMDCPTCIPVLEREVKRLDGVDEVRGNYMNKTLKVTYNPNRVQVTEIEATIERLGYRIAYKRYPGTLSKLRGLLKGEEAEEILPLTDADFPGKVLQASKPVAVLFSSRTCPPCRFFKKQFREIAERFGGKADFYEMDIASTETWRKYDIMSIPSVLIFRDGRTSRIFKALPQGEDIASELGE